MKMKTFLLILICSLIMSACSAYASVRLEVNAYKCHDCGEMFFSFRGDALDHRDLKIPQNQMRRVRMFSNRDRNLRNCRSEPSHAFVRDGVKSMTLGQISSNLDRFAALKDGGSITVGFKTWECMLCGKTFYSIGKDNLNIKRWDEQPRYIYSLKGKRSIEKCSARGYHGHVFKEKSEGSISSYDLANPSILEKIYWTAES
ncbi:MAG: hypothetical protein IJL01_06945 [Synergistaceae bacterium]|nr:hypothetical protein [Synergistaceae bacterium]